MLDFLGRKLLYTAGEELNLTEESDLTLGIRPEFLPIVDGGALTGTAYSTLPAGMETTIKIKIDDTILSSVVFGSIDYAVDQEIKFNIVGDGIVLFDGHNRVALGSAKVL